MDTIPTGTSAVPSSPTTQQVQDAIQPLAADGVQLEKEIAAIIAAYKAKGASGAAALLPSLAPSLSKSWADVQTAMPTIKSGYKTTEFWITSVAVGLTTYLTTTGKLTPDAGATLIGAVTAVYAVVRGLLKK